MEQANIFILIDKSGSMCEEPIIQAFNMVDKIISSLANNTETSNSAKVCVIEYNISASLIVPLTEVKKIKSSWDTTCSGPKNLGEALKLAVKNNIEQYKSTLFVITKGKPSDIQLYNEEVPYARNSFENIYLIHGNLDKSSVYQTLTKNILSWTTFDYKKIIQKIYGGRELTDAQGNELLQAPPSIIEINF